MPPESPVVILANGIYPRHPVPLEILETSGTLICCDGAADALLAHSLKPTIVIGDLDSISSEARTAFDEQLVEKPSEAIGDLEKAIAWSVEQQVDHVTIIGATGKRDDYSFTSVAMLWSDFGLTIDIVTETGRFSVIRSESTFSAYDGQPVALLPANLSLRMTTTGLAFDLGNEPLPAMHGGISNWALGDTFEVTVSGGPVIVFQAHPSP